MIAALIAGERDSQVPAGLARTRMKANHDALVEALTGMFDEHHGQIAQLLLDQAACCDTAIARLDILIKEHLAGITAAWGIDASGETGPAAGTGPGTTKTRQQLPARLPRPGRHRRRRHPDLPRRALPPHRPPPRQRQSPGRCRPLHLGDHLASA
jgi:hypothetical protein